MRLLFVFFLLAIWGSSVVNAQELPTDFRKLQDSIDAQPKPVLLLISTDWCVYCRMQKFQIRLNRQFKRSSRHFYFAELNAETKETLKFKGKLYHYIPNGQSTGVHELAVALGKHNGMLAYPTWVILDKDLHVLNRYSGVLNRKELQLVIESLVKLHDQED